MLPVDCHIYIDWISASRGAELTAAKCDLAGAATLADKFFKLVDDASPGWLPHRILKVEPAIEWAVNHALELYEIGLAVSKDGVISVALRLRDGKAPVGGGRSCDGIDNLATLICHLVRRAFGDDVRYDESDDAYEPGPVEVDPIPVETPDRSLPLEPSYPLLNIRRLHGMDEIAAGLLTDTQFARLIVRRTGIAQFPLADRHVNVALAARPLIKRDRILSAVEQFEGIALRRETPLSVNTWLFHIIFGLTAGFSSLLLAEPLFARFDVRTSSSSVVAALVLFTSCVAAFWQWRLFHRALGPSPDDPPHLAVTILIEVCAVFSLAFLTGPDLNLQVWGAAMVSILLSATAILGSVLLIRYGSSWTDLVDQILLGARSADTDKPRAAHDTDKPRAPHDKVRTREGHLNRWAMTAPVLLIIAMALALFGGSLSASWFKFEKDDALPFESFLDNFIWALPIFGIGLLLTASNLYSQSSAATAMHAITHRRLKDVENMLKGFRALPKILFKGSDRADMIDLVAEAEPLALCAQRVDDIRGALRARSVLTTAAIAGGLFALLQLKPLKDFAPDAASGTAQAAVPGVIEQYTINEADPDGGAGGDAGESFAQYIIVDQSTPEAAPAPIAGTNTIIENNVTTTASQETGLPTPFPMDAMYSSYGKHYLTDKSRVFTVFFANGKSDIDDVVCAVAWKDDGTPGERILRQEIAGKLLPTDCKDAQVEANFNTKLTTLINKSKSYARPDCNGNGDAPDMLVFGFTDSKGGPGPNLNLSQLRADSLKTYWNGKEDDQGVEAVARGEYANWLFPESAYVGAANMRRAEVRVCRKG